MTEENPFENWTYVPVDSGGRYNSREKIFEARGYCEARGSEFVREDLFEFQENQLIAVEEKRGKVSSLVILGILEGKKILPVSSDKRREILNYLNREIIEVSGGTMDGVFWNTEVEVRRPVISNTPPASLAK